MAKLKSCDCKNPNVRLHFGEYKFSGKTNKYWFVCDGCGKETETCYDTIEEATSAWNRIMK